MRKFIFLFLFCLFFVPKVNASEYLLPYPGPMPGNKFYKFTQIKDQIDDFLYFGNLAKFDLHLRLSDKYLVESKTLFEYDQYLLAIVSLKKSNDFFRKAKFDLKSAEKEGKNIQQKEEILEKSSKKHIETLINTRKILPKVFSWSIEDNKSQILKLWEEIDLAVIIRNGK